MKWSGLFWVSVFLVVLTGCGGGEVEKQDAQAPAEPDLELIRGLYAFGHEVRALQPCGEVEDLWVIDSSGTLKAAHGALAGSMTDAPRVFVVATGRTGPAPDDGFGEDYAGSVTIKEVIYVALEGHGCDFDLTRFVYRASGNEPFWMVEVLPEGMTFSRPGYPTVTWPGVSREATTDQLVFTGSGGDQPGHLTIAPGPAYDSMSGAYHGHRADFELGGEKFAGVAMRGFAAD